MVLVVAKIILTLAMKLPKIFRGVRNAASTGAWPSLSAKRIRLTRTKSMKSADPVRHFIPVLAYVLK